MDRMTLELDADVLEGLRRRAAGHGWSAEEEALSVLRASVKPSFAHPPLTPAEIEDRVARLKALARKPSEPFDQKQFTDELWDFIE